LLATKLGENPHVYQPFMGEMPHEKGKRNFTNPEPKMGK
jgi:hypothetical protein